MQNKNEPTTAHKKKLLIAQGAMFRLGLTNSTREVRANLQPNALAKSALNSLVTSASSALGLGHGFSLKSLSDANFQTILPIAISAISLLVKRRSLIKPLLIGVIALSAAGVVARFVFRKKIEWQRRAAARRQAT